MVSRKKQLKLFKLFTFDVFGRENGSIFLNKIIFELSKKTDSFSVSIYTKPLPSQNLFLKN